MLEIKNHDQELLIRSLLIKEKDRLEEGIDKLKSIDKIEATNELINYKTKRLELINITLKVVEDK